MGIGVVEHLLRRLLRRGTARQRPLDGPSANRVRGCAGDADADPCGRLGDAGGKDRVRVGIWTARRRMGCASRLLQLDLEHETSLAIAREKVFDRLAAFAVLPGGADACGECDERRLQVAARCLPCPCAQVAAERRLRADPMVCDVARGGRQRLGRLLDSATVVIAPMVTVEPLR